LSGGSNAQTLFYSAGTDSGPYLLSVSISANTILKTNTTGPPVSSVFISLGVSGASDIVEVNYSGHKYYFISGSQILVYRDDNLTTPYLQIGGSSSGYAGDGEQAFAFLPPSSNSDVLFNYVTAIMYCVNDDGSNLRFFVIDSGNSAIRKLYPQSGGSSIGGDPHIRPLFGSTYLLPNDENIYNLFDSNESGDKKFTIKSKNWFLPNDIKQKDLANLSMDDSEIPILKGLWSEYTYMKYVSFNYGTEHVIIDMDTLQTVKYEENKVNTHELEIIEDDQTHNILSLSKISKSSKGMYDNMYNVYTTPSTTIERTIELNTSKYNLTFTLQRDTSSFGHRNNISLDIVFSEDCVESLTGCLISKKYISTSDCLIDQATNERHFKE